MYRGSHSGCPFFRFSNRHQSVSSQTIHMVDHIYGISYIRLMQLEPHKLFAAMSHDLRLRTLMLLEQHGELCVCELTHVFDVSQPKISRHLALLRDLGIVSDRREGLWIYYRLNDEIPDWAVQVIKDTLNGVASAAPFVADVKALNKMPARPGTLGCS